MSTKEFPVVFDGLSGEQIKEQNQQRESNVYKSFKEIKREQLAV